MNIAALYIDPRGPYPRMQGVDCWDEQRDARLYAGPWPVIAHPPCGPWGAFAHLCTEQDASCGPAAVGAVRAFGGVMEHPKGSRLWRHCALPLPGEFPDQHGGSSYFCNQVHWGHPCSKPTILYTVGISHEAFFRDYRDHGGVPTHDMMGSRGRNASADRGGLIEASQEKRRRTPPAFAEWLVALARTANVSRSQSSAAAVTQGVPAP